jgi:hypothetical protein|tara:strand:- start:159 stop:335 length:177 start_codon:yes stop_codon:yes gene_type:complete
MRSKFIPLNKDNKSRSHDQQQQRRVLPDISWAEFIISVDGGWQAFESFDDYKTWLNQK